MSFSLLQHSSQLVESNSYSSNLPIVDDCEFCSRVMDVFQDDWPHQNFLLGEEENFIAKFTQFNLTIILTTMGKLPSSLESTKNVCVLDFSTSIKWSSDCNFSIFLASTCRLCAMYFKSWVCISFSCSGVHSSSLGFSMCSPSFIPERTMWK